MKTSKIRSKLNVLGVCAGQGALLYPFRKNLLANIEVRGVFHTPKEEQWKLNFGDIPFYKGYNLPEFDKKVDVIISSPDCGASSIMRLSKVKELGNPKDNKSLNLVIQSILNYQPRVFLIENLPRLLGLLPTEYLEDIFKDYILIFHENSVSAFGNSQVSRKRLVIVGVHRKTGKKYKNSFNDIFQVNVPKTTRELLKPLDDYRSNFIPWMSKTLAMYDYRKLPEKKNLTVAKIHRLWVRAFSKEKKWPIKTAKMSTLPGVYRLEYDKPPLTLRPADRQFRPDGYPLGTEDFKSIMGLPEGFKIYMPTEVENFEKDFKVYHYWLNKSRYTISKGSVYEVGIWFRDCLRP